MSGARRYGSFVGRVRFRAHRASERFWSWSKWARVPALAIIVVALYAGWVSLLPQPSTLTTVSALSERVEFAVTNPQQSVVPISGMKIAPPQDGELTGCVRGALHPHEGSAVAYERAVVGDLAIVLVGGKANFERLSDGKQFTLARGVEFVVSSECKDGPPPRYPIWGPLRLGDEKITATGTGMVAPNMLLEGKLVIQARAISSRLVPFNRDTLYTVKEIALPAGARVESKQADERDALWWGSVYVDTQKVGLQVQAATEASALSLFRPGRTRSEDADVISITALTQLFSDPNVIRVQAMALAFIALLERMIAWFAKKSES